MKAEHANGAAGAGEHTRLLDEIPMRELKLLLKMIETAEAEPGPAIEQERRIRTFLRLSAHMEKRMKIDGDEREEKPKEPSVYSRSDKRRELKEKLFRLLDEAARREDAQKPE